MSEGWSKLLDIGPLADGRADIDFSIPLKEFPRVLPSLAAPDGEARGRVHFSREGRVAVAEVSVVADVMLLCQRCLSPLKWPVDSTGRAALVATHAEVGRVPETLETVLAERPCRVIIETDNRRSLARRPGAELAVGARSYTR